MSLTGEEKLETAPSDKRFPTTNQAKHCYMCARACAPPLPVPASLPPGRVLCSSASPVLGALPRTLAPAHTAERV